MTVEKSADLVKRALAPVRCGVSKRSERFRSKRDEHRRWRVVHGISDPIDRICRIKFDGVGTPSKRRLGVGHEAEVDPGGQRGVLGDDEGDERVEDGLVLVSEIDSNRNGPGERRNISPTSSSGKVIMNRSPDPTAISLRSSMTKFAISGFSVGGRLIVSRMRSGSLIGRKTRICMCLPGCRFGNRTVSDTSASLTKVVWDTRSMRSGPRWALAAPLVTPNATATTATSRSVKRRITGLAEGRSVDAQPAQSPASYRAKAPRHWPLGC